MCNGIGIVRFINTDTNLRRVVEDALNKMDAEQYVGFHYSESSGEWDYWLTNSADATASNRYYTCHELEALLDDSTPPIHKYPEEP